MIKVKLSARINPYNYDMLRAIGDLLFLNENKNNGDVSKALDWVLTTFRTNTEFSKLLELLISYSRYERGSREKEDIEKTKQLLVILKSVEDSQ